MGHGNVLAGSGNAGAFPFDMTSDGMAGQRSNGSPVEVQMRGFFPFDYAHGQNDNSGEIGAK